MTHRHPARSTPQFAIFVVLAITALPSHAGTPIVVDGVCTLTDAILAANTDAMVGSCDAGAGADTIVIDVDVTLFAADTVNSTVHGSDFAGLPDVTTEMTIQAGAALVIQRDATLGCSSDGSDHFRILNVLGAGGDLTLVGLTFRNGCALRGGAVHAGGPLSVQGCIFQDNAARAEDGITLAAQGGALHHDGGSLLVADSTFSGNQAIGAAATGAGSGQEAEGGAISSTRGDVIVDASRFENNAARGGSAEAVGGDATGGGFHRDGGIGAVELVGSEFIGNLAIGGDGVTGSGGRAEGGAIKFRADTLRNLVLEGNRAQGGDSMSAAGGFARGGAIEANADLIENVFATDNEAIGGDGVTGGNARGGAVYPDGTGELVQLTLDGNLARGGAATTGGGGEARGGGLGTSSTGLVLHLTASGNRVEGGDSVNGSGGDARGGGWYEDSNADIVSHITIAENTAVAGIGPSGDGVAEGGGLYENASDLENFGNNILAGNTVAVGAGAPTAEDCFSANEIFSVGYNWIQVPGNCVLGGPADVTGVDPVLLSLGRRGCVTPLADGTCLPTHALALTSPALDQGSCVVSTATTDARGSSRPIDFAAIADTDDGCDPGAYESRDENANGIEDGFELFLDGFESGDTSAWSTTVP